MKRSCGGHHSVGKWESVDIWEKYRKYVMIPYVCIKWRCTPFSHELPFYRKIATIECTHWLISLCNPRDHCRHSLFQDCWIVTLITSNHPTYLHTGTTLWRGLWNSLVESSPYKVTWLHKLLTRQILGWKIDVNAFTVWAKITGGTNIKK